MSEQFRDRFRELAASLGSDSFAYCAKTMGISRMTYTLAYAFGEMPSKTTLHRIAKYFNVSVDYLLGKTDEK